MFGWFEGLTRSRERKRMKKYQRKDAGEAWDEHRSREVRTLEKRKKKKTQSCSGRPTLACSGHSSQRDPAAAGQHWLAAARWVFPEIKELFTYRAAAGQQWLAAAAFDGFELICIFHQFLYVI